MKRKIKGYITVYLALVICVLLSLVMLVIEGARQQTIKFQTECVMDAGMNSIFAEYHREMNKQYGLFFIDDSYGGFSGRVSNTKSHLLSYMNMNFHASQDMSIPLFRIKDITSINADNGDLFKTSFATDNSGEVLRYQIVRYEKDIKGISVFDKDPMITDIEKLLADYQEYQEKRILTNENIANIKNEINSKREEPVNIDNPADSVEELSGISVLYYAIGDASSLTGTRINLGDYISHRNYEEGVGLYSEQESPGGLISNPFYCEYVFDKCGYYKNLKDNSRMKYQIEYILKGKNSDLDNLEAVAMNIFEIRYAVNMANLLASSEKQLQAEEMAAAVALVLENPQLFDSVKWSIIYAWAYAESAKDLRILYDGHPLGVMKTDEDWNTPISQIVTFKSHLSEYKIPAGTMSYKDYLYAFLNLESTKNQNMRLMDVMEMDIRLTPGNGAFKMDNQIYQTAAKVNIHSEYGYNYDITRQFSYN